MRWEYTTFAVSLKDADEEKIQQELNDRGAEGWELVSVIGTEGTFFLGIGQTGVIFAFFKRPIADR